MVGRFLRGPGRFRGMSAPGDHCLKHFLNISSVVVLSPRPLVDAAITRLTDAEEILLSGVPRAERERLAQLLRRLALSVDRFSALAGAEPEPAADAAAEPGAADSGPARA